MIDGIDYYYKHPYAKQLRWWIVVLSTSSLILGCSQIPDVVNPVEWYRSSIDFFSGQEEKSSKKETPSKVRTAFPKLSSVTQQRLRSEKRAQGLVADKGNRRYSQQVARQGEAVNALGAPPPKPSTQISSQRILKEATGETLVDKSSTTQLLAAPSTSMDLLTQKTEQTTTIDSNQSTEIRMANRLIEIRTQANQKLQLPANSRGSLRRGSFDTVVVSSNGVELAAIENAEPNSAAEVKLMSIKRQNQPQEFGGVKVATIMFANSSASLSKRDRSILENVRQLQKERGGKIRIVGHASSRTRDTDPISHKMINFRVSAARAEAVAQELIRMGIDRKALQIDAVSDSAPVYFEYMPSGEAGNRRAEIYLLG